MSIASRCPDCCPSIALRGLISTAEAQGFSSSALSADRYLTKTYNGVYYNTGATSVNESGTTVGEGEQSWGGSLSYVTATATNGTVDTDCSGTATPINPDPRQLVLGCSPVTVSGSGCTGGATYYDGYFTENGEDVGVYHFCFHQEATNFSMPCSVGLSAPFAGAKSTLSSSSISYVGTGEDEEITDETTYVLYNYDAGGSVDFSNADTFENVQTRLSAAQSSGHAYGVEGEDYGDPPTEAIDIDFFQDRPYPNYRYHHPAGGYAGILEDSQSVPGCSHPTATDEEGTTALFRDRINYGLPMMQDPYFYTRFTTYELDLAWAKRRFHQLRNFTGCFSIQGKTLPPGLAIRFERVNRACWGELVTSPVCALTGGAVGTTTNVERELVASEPITDPIDERGSTAYADASWDAVDQYLLTPDWSLTYGIQAAGFCLRRLFHFTSDAPVRVTVLITRLNYKDYYDGGAITDFYSDPTTTSATLDLDQTLLGYYVELDAGRLLLTPENNRQEVWVKVTKVTRIPTLEEEAEEGYDEAALPRLPVQSVGMLSKLRVGNMGFPQLDHMAEGALYKGAHGFRRNTLWYRKLTYTYQESIVSAPPSTCPDSCVRYDDSQTLDFHTEVVFERTPNPDTVYDDWLGMSAVFGHDWQCTSAYTVQGEGDGIELPTVDHTSRPPIWGSLGFGTITSTTATSAEETTSASIHIGILTQSGVPMRSFYGDAMEEQDKLGDAFTTFEGCGGTNSLCTDDCSATRAALYSNNRNPVVTNIADPFFGFNNEVSAEWVEMPLSNEKEGYRGSREDPLEDPPGARIADPILSTDLFSVAAPGSGIYVTIRHLHLVHAS